MERSRLPAERQGFAAAFNYEGPARSLVAALKFGGATALAGEMAEQMLSRIDLLAGEPRWIIAAPAHPARRRARGYNQSLLLARAIAESTGGEAAEWLKRDRSTPPQSELGRAQRLAFPAGGITLDDRALRQSGLDPLAPLPTNVLVCDDVATTGVTLEKCTQAIRDRQPGDGQRPLRAVVFAVA